MKRIITDSNNNNIRDKLSVLPSLSNDDFMKVQSEINDLNNRLKHAVAYENVNIAETLLSDSDVHYVAMTLNLITKTAR